MTENNEVVKAFQKNPTDPAVMNQALGNLSVFKDLAKAVLDSIDTASIKEGYEATRKQISRTVDNINKELDKENLSFDEKYKLYQLLVEQDKLSKEIMADEANNIFLNNVLKGVVGLGIGGMICFCVKVIFGGGNNPVPQQAA